MSIRKIMNFKIKGQIPSDTNKGGRISSDKNKEIVFDILVTFL
jgi:hypothetical protein